MTIVEMGVKSAEELLKSQRIKLRSVDCRVWRRTLLLCMFRLRPPSSHMQRPDRRHLGLCIRYADTKKNSLQASPSAFCVLTESNAG